MGFKKTSELIAVSFGLTETAPGIFTESEVALQLDVLNNEIAVILAVDLDLSEPEAIAGIDTAVRASVTATTVTAMPSLANTNTITTGKEMIRAAGFIDSGVGFTRRADSSYTGDIDYVALIATNNFFVQVQGTGNTAAKNLSGRVWLYRAKADSSTYAALVQSEVLSS
jgi:hypothetical protein